MKVRVADNGAFIELLAGGKPEKIRTPAFVYDEGSVLGAVNRLKSIAENLGCKLLFSLKALSLVDALRLMVPSVDGFAASSLFEASLAREVLRNNGTVHLTSPALRDDELDVLAGLCDYVSFNSLPQWERCQPVVGRGASCGLRVNPQLSFVEDDRYNPCRKHSKLGVPLDALRPLLASGDGKLRGLRGLHFHSNCESDSLEPLLETVRHLDASVGNFFNDLEWVNLGGGYEYGDGSSHGALHEAVDLLRRKYGVEVFIEPGEAVVGRSACIVSSVVDLFDSEGKEVAVLDTTVNHVPQVYEYQYRPEVAGATRPGGYRYILAGATCLAGDLFGEYGFDAPLAVGSRVIFERTGAYALARAHMFNGINLPDVYALTAGGEVTLKKRFTYQDYISRW